VQFDVLGPLRVRNGDDAIEVARLKERAVLAALLIEANHVVPMDRLVNQLWGDEPPSRAIGTLHAYISNLRRLLEPDRPPRAPAQLIVSRAPGYLLIVGPDDVDATRFERLTAAAYDALADGDAAAALRGYDDALALWRGDPYSEFRYDDFAGAAIRRLEELHAATLEQRIDALLALGRHVAAVPDIEGLLVDEPVRERLWSQLVVALYRSGRQVEALDACRRARRVLDELGLEPGSSLRALETAVLNQDPQLDLPPAAVTTSATDRPPAVPSGGAHLGLHGREAELAALDDSLAAAMHGRSAVVLLTGEPGIGKTALADDLLRRAAARGAVTASGRCPEGGATPLLWPWLQVVRRLRGDDPDEPLGALVDQVHDGAADQQARLMRELLVVVRRRAAVQPVALLIDDLQWADDLSHRLLRLAVDDLADTAVLLVLTMRTPHEHTTAVDDTVSTLVRSGRTAQIALTGLPLPATRALVADLVPVEPGSEFVDAVHHRSGGNPFFTVELARLLAAERRLSAHDVAAAAVPRTIRDVVRRRLQRLPDAAGALLAVAAVVGPDVDVRVVADMSDADEETVIDTFELAVAAGVLAETDQPGTYRFAHDLVRETIRDGVPGLRRARLHQRALDALLRLHGDTRRTAHELARHAVGAVAASGAEAAVERLLASARVALTDLAIDHAHRQASVAAELVEQLPPSPARDRLEVQVQSRLGQLVFHLDADSVEATERHQHALRLCDPHDVEQLGGVLLGIGSYAPLAGDFAAGVAAGQRLLELATDSRHAELRASGHYLCSMAAWQGDASYAREHIDAALAEGSDALDTMWTSVPVTTMRGHRALVRALAGDHDWHVDAIGALEEALRNHDNWSRCWTLVFGAAAAVAMDDREGCARMLRAGGDGVPLDYTSPVIDAARAWAHGGDPTVVEAALTSMHNMRDGMFRAPLLTMLADLRARAGDAAGSRRAAVEAEAVARGFGALGWVAAVARGRQAPAPADVS
jgi:DNA-binding SARP family transcriptional activator